MGILDHYPDIKRWWRRARCVCGLRLRKCPDWNSRLTRWVDHYSREMPAQLGRRPGLRP